ncbi:S24 family peptidase [Acidovorax delafieldii]|nr:S24 family peptidase [Acidovorax delafieldii]
MNRAGRSASASPPGDLDLVPGVRDRLQARLAAMGVPADKTVSHVAGITHRASQSVRRWFDAPEPGLPDLESFARLCAGLGCSADEIIGALRPQAEDQAHCTQLIQVANCIQAIADSLAHRGQLGTPVQVPGDEMAPHLKAGDLVFVDSTVTELAGNGIYAFTCNGSLLIRRVERRIDRSIVLKCDNKAYQDYEWTSATAAARRRVKILGKVRSAISVKVFGGR